MADITCARCGHEEPLHACDKCSDSDTRYCSMDCMRAHAEIHKPICDTAGCFVLGTNQCDEVADESPTCLVCFESGGTMPCGCACRGSAGWAHARCIAKAAEHAVDPEAAYHTCRICKQSYSGPMNLEIARARFRMVRRFDTQDDVSAAVHLARACNQRGIEDVSMTLYRKAIELQIELSGEMSIKAAEVWQGFGQLFLNSMTESRDGGTRAVRAVACDAEKAGWRQTRGGPRHCLHNQVHGPPSQRHGHARRGSGIILTSVAN